MMLLLLVPLGVLDPDEQQKFNRRDSSRHSAGPSTSSEGSARASVSSPVTPFVVGMLTA